MPWYWPFPVPPRLDWLQVEISTHCNATCVYCPRTLLAGRWCNRLMPKEVFVHLLPMLDRTRLVYLQGWGEPFTHPDFFEFARRVKAAGCQVGTTTNGRLLTEDICRQVIKTGIDVVGFSLAGIENGVNDRIRRGTSLAQIRDTIATLNRLKAQQGLQRPALHVAYLLLRSRLDDVDTLPAFLASLQIDQAVVSTLDCIANRALVEEAILPADQDEYASLLLRLEAMTTAGATLGLPIQAWLAAPPPPSNVAREYGPTPIAPLPCTENIQRSAFISAAGEVSPCVHSALPVTGEVTHWIGGEETTYTPLVFGNITQQSFAAIWRAPGYQAFRTAHRLGKPPDPCRNCPRIRMHAVSNPSARLS